MKFMQIYETDYMHFKFWLATGLKIINTTLVNSMVCLASLKHPLIKTRRSHLSVPLCSMIVICEYTQYARSLHEEMTRLVDYAFSRHIPPIVWLNLENN